MAELELELEEEGPARNPAGRVQRRTLRRWPFDSSHTPLLLALELLTYTIPTGYNYTHAAAVYSIVIRITNTVSALKSTTRTCTPRSSWLSKSPTLPSCSTRHRSMPLRPLRLHKRTAERTASTLAADPHRPVVILSDTVSINLHYTRAHAITCPSVAYSG